MSPIPEFGEVLPGVNYIERPGAYAFIENESGLVAVIRTPLGLFLPGGGLDPGESFIQGLYRELKEEIGYSLTQANLITRAIQYHWSGHYGQYFKKVGHFFETKALAPATPSLQFEHELLWFTCDKLQIQLTQEFQRWATAEWQKQKP